MYFYYTANQHNEGAKREILIAEMSLAYKYRAACEDTHFTRVNYGKIRLLIPTVSAIVLIFYPGKIPDQVILAAIHL